MVNLRPARVWKRILAFIVDIYLCIMVFASFFLIIEREVSNPMNILAQGFSPAAIAALVFASVFIFLYHVFTEYIVGQTPGMLFFGVCVETTKPKQKTLTLWQAIGRNVFVLPIFPFTALWLIEPLYYVFHGERLTEHWTSTVTLE